MRQRPSPIGSLRVCSDRIRRPPLLAGVLLVLALLAAGTFAAPAALPAQTLEEATRGMERHDGFVPFYWDAEQGRLLLEVRPGGEEFLYLVSLATGVGSDALGLDRGEIGPEYLARWERAGPRVFLVLENPTFRAATNPDPALRRSVRESFPVSRVGGFGVEAASEDGARVLVDATDFFLRDAMDVAGALARDDQGSFRVDAERSSVHLPRTKAFPENTEVEASLTFASDEPGGEVRRHTPDGRALTLRQHHSFVALPDDGYEPRAFDPRIGLFPVTFYDYGRPLEEGYARRYAIRHRLQKRNPGAAMSEPVEPIVYYLDPAVPEPYRSAFIEGGGWWNEVFEAAGFRNAFRIEPMPEGMDPLDARYNVIQWVHRTEAGSSIGPSFVDPRTGEIIKAAVRMDSHRSLVDYDIYMGTAPARAARDGTSSASPISAGGRGSRALERGPVRRGPGAGWRGALADCALEAGPGPALDWVAALDPDVTGEAFAMARRRQHAAHEIGHTLGLAHNFVAASYGRASVMDYPAPLVRLTEDGGVDLSDAYRPGPGAYDSIAIRWAYSELPEGQEAAGLDAIVREAMDRGLKFITNPDEGSWSSFPEASTWINGSDAVEELERVLEVRRVLVDRFGEEAVAPGEPLWELQRRFARAYLHHRFTLSAAIKAVGGMEYRYAVRGDPGPPMELVPAAKQRRALELALRALSPEELAVPEDVLGVLAPEPFGYRTGERDFESRAAPAFDHLGVARTLAESVAGGLLQPRRMARVAAFHDRRPELPSPTEVVGRLVDGTWGVPQPDRHAALARVAERVVMEELMELAADDDATPEARAAAEWGLRRIAGGISPDGGGAAGPGAGLDAGEAAHRTTALSDIRRFLARPFGQRVLPAPLRPPAATPIGDPGTGAGAGSGSR